MLVLGVVKLLAIPKLVWCFVCLFCVVCTFVTALSFIIVLILENCTGIVDVRGFNTNCFRHENLMFSQPVGQK